MTGSLRGRRFARRILLDKLSGLERGRLRLVDRDNTIVLGRAEPLPGEPVATVQVHDDRFWPKLLFGGSIGASEAYMAGLWTSDDLTEALRFFLVNRDAMDQLEGGAGRLLMPVHRVYQTLRANTRVGSRRNIGAHYDLSNEFFELFLDRHMMYSSAVFEDADGRDLGDDLEAAGEAKLERICRKAQLGPDDHVLEIGTGWGGFAAWAASRYGCRVTTTTISQQQFDAARARIKAAGLEGRVEVLLRDYRDLKGQYDKLVSIEMIEAVGYAHLEEYFRVCAERLKSAGRMVLQGITIADRYEAAYRRGVDFIQRYVFPGAELPSMSAIGAAAKKSGDLQVVHVEDIGPDYAKTLGIWRRRFFDQIEEVRRLGFSETFVRLWDFYLCYCEAGFLERTTGDVQVILSKPEDRGRIPLGVLSAPTPHGAR
ncbi:MAG: cyclopropane-fatty-acyl-phospholipid synthase family protein [Acidobacteriota bacterium]